MLPKKSTKNHKQFFESALNKYEEIIEKINKTDIDIINCSITENENSKKINKSKIGKVNDENNCKYNSIDDCLWLNTDNLSTKENISLKTETEVKKYYDHLSPFTIISKKVPEIKTLGKGFLSKSKLKSIQLWLQSNDFESFQTPPFANLSITPTKFKEEQEILGRNVTEDNESSLLDSDVEGVLKAVYGDQWMQKYSHKKSKTEPKKCLHKNFLTLTEVKGKKAIYSTNVRRNILAASCKSLTDQTNNLHSGLNESITSGFKLLNFNDSDESLNSINKNIQLNLAERTKSKKTNYYQKNNNKPSLSKNTQNNIILNKRTKILPPKKINNNLTRGKNSIKSPQKTFLGSLSVSTSTLISRPDAQYYKLNFNSRKDELIKILYKLFNSEVFDNKLPHDMNFSWNSKLRGTAGFCYNKRITKSTGEVVRISRIEFSIKIVDRADRLRDTMIHELCHAASWIIEGKLDGHGPVWNSWAAKAMSRFPELPSIKRCHNYDIISKYLYRCTTCGYSVKRHSKSLNIEKKRCGHCFGVFKLYFNKKKKGATEIPEFNITTTLPTPNKFALFIKENYQIIKSTTENIKHAEIMKILSQQYACTKSKILPSVK